MVRLVKPEINTVAPNLLKKQDLLKNCEDFLKS